MENTGNSQGTVQERKTKIDRKKAIHVGIVYSRTDNTQYEVSVNRWGIPLKTKPKQSGSKRYMKNGEKDY